jgi:hypothetical protein
MVPRSFVGLNAPTMTHIEQVCDGGRHAPTDAEVPEKKSLAGVVGATWIASTTTGRCRPVRGSHICVAGMSRNAMPVWRRFALINEGLHHVERDGHGKKIELRKNTENPGAKFGKSIVDKTEFRSRDTASRWIASAEEWNARVGKREAAVARHKAEKRKRREKRSSAS